MYLVLRCVAFVCCISCCVCVFCTDAFLVELTCAVRVCSCERGCLHHLHRLDGSGLPPLAALLPPGQSPAGVGLLSGLLPVEPAADWSPRGGPRPLLVRATFAHCPPLPAAVVGLPAVGVATADKLYGQRCGGVAIPGHRRTHLVLQLVQCGGGPHPGQKPDLPFLHDGGLLPPSGHLVVPERRGADRGVRPGPDHCAAAFLPARAALQSHLLLLLPPQTVATPTD